ncbi:hypothetical protein E4U30_003492 [Claviceps sp. LM220 group G6]|nr:hypothetical protein E4U15_000065 [Claviceps sp. LM218 group G6]KAG6094290.1 hypothetical protein E4U30_003492 [Claviceps sp. LM220 group G6]KAG6109565.1 hypothetical protein E4U31_006770 [Claviceps sp. LM219 group G6]
MIVDYRGARKKEQGSTATGLDVVGSGGFWWGKFGGLLGFWAQELIEPHYGVLSALDTVQTLQNTVGSFMAEQPVPVPVPVNQLPESG